MTKAKQGTTLQAKAIEPDKARKTRMEMAMTEAAQLEICARIANGESLTHVCKDPKLPARQTVTKYLVSVDAENSGFADRYRRARESLLDVYADEVITIADDGTTDYIIKTGRNGHEYMAVDQEHIQRSRLRVESRKWLLSKLRPEEYGDKMAVDVDTKLTVKHDIGTLSEREKMRRFALFMVEDHRQPVIEGEVLAGTQSLRQPAGPEDDDAAA